MIQLIINTDGASRGNPGPASYGFVIQDLNSQVLYREGERLGITTNNVAEYTAVLKSLQYVAENYDVRETAVDVVSDSQLVASQLSGKFKIKSPHLYEIFIQIKEVAAKFPAVSYRNVPRAENQLADAMANLALDRKS